MAKTIMVILTCIFLWSVHSGAAVVSQDSFAEKRNLMIKNNIEGRGIKNKQVLKALKAVPREKFVPEELTKDAYGDHPLPIGYGQTISQPYIVAYMTEILLEGNTLEKALEIGTGSGYQAAILSHVAKEVYTIEIIEALCKRGGDVLKKEGYKNVHVKCGDGYYGWAEHGPYDGILVTAASPDIPPPLVNQLKNGGRMILPVGSIFGFQYLVLVTKDNEGKVKTQNLLPVRFVPLTRKIKADE